MRHRGPEIQEIPGNQGDGQLLVQAISSSIHCEIKNAINYIKDMDEKAKSINKRRIADWLDDWGAQVTITLTVDEKSSANPMGSYIPSKIFSLFDGVNISSDATRVEVLDYYYTIAEVQQSGPCSDAILVQLSTHPLGSLLIQSDLKLKEWLSSVVEGHLTGDIPVTMNKTENKSAKNGITHHVTFTVVTSGNIMPTWKLVHGTINPMFMASRTRTHDLLITFGPNFQTPPDPITGKKINSLGAGTPAANTNLAAQIGIAIGNQMIISNLP